MSRRCLICSNINPCREHSEDAQDMELSRNMRQVAREMERRKATVFEHQPAAQSEEKS